MKISKKLAIKILEYLNKNKDFYFPFLIICKEYKDRDDDYLEIKPEDWKIIHDNKDFKTFEVWENLQNLQKETLQLMLKGFVEKITS